MAKFVKMRIFHTKWEKNAILSHFSGHEGGLEQWLGFCKQCLVIFWAQNDPKWPKMTQNDPKMTRNRFFSKMFLHHFWPFLGWFWVILGCFERVLVIFGPRNAFKWPHLGSKMAQKRAKNHCCTVYTGISRFSIFEEVWWKVVFSVKLCETSRLYHVKEHSFGFDLSQNW